MYVRHSYCIFLEKFKDVEKIFIYDDRDIELDNLKELKNNLKIKVKIYKATKGKLNLVETINYKNNLEIIVEKIILNYFDSDFKHLL